MDSYELFPHRSSEDNSSVAFWLLYNNDLLVQSPMSLTALLYLLGEINVGDSTALGIVQSAVTLLVNQSLTGKMIFQNQLI